MKKSLQNLFLILLLGLIMLPVTGQDLSGYWQGMDYGPRPSAVSYWPGSMQITQNGSNLTGSFFQQVTSQTPYFALWDISGASVSGNAGEMHFAVIKEMYVATFALFCYSKYSFTYDPIEEKMTGVREFDCAGMKLTLELYRLRLKSPDTFCKGETAKLEVTGKDVRWYSDKQKSKLLHRGNIYETQVSQTDTFFLSQTFHDTETPVVPVIIKVNEAKITDVQLTDANCGKDNGIIAVKATGAAPVTYSIDNDAFQASPVFQGLYPKTYKITAKTAAGCTDTRQVTIGKRFTPTFREIHTLNPCEAGSSGIGAVAQGGYDHFSYALDDGPFQEKGYFPDLPGGEYLVRAKDSVGCEVSLMVRVPDAAERGVTLQDVEVQHGNCGSQFGSVSIIASATGLLSYSLDGITYESSPFFHEVEPGTYTASVKNQDGCVATKEIVVRTVPAPEFRQVIEKSASCGENDGSLTIHAIGSGPLTYSIDGINFTDDTVFTSLSPGHNTVNVKDTTGCIVGRSYSIGQDCFEQVFIPNAFTPDTDGKNEAMNMKFSGSALKIKSFRLYNRWGSVVAFRRDQTVESGYALWDGFYKGTRVQPGIYPYELMIEFDNGRTQVIRNTITLLH
ncbi:T9SS type B sorting domain-containing protein [Dyadobacter crusticola]|uniref:T9SS type B sorting domain-containing protein n=1 Tax=Dyadobacter crusticola TaxID=292407 RepID=UPI0004E1F4B0|nr:gliding motility-associated C-terminal domain-containing protein [Dyadobacter crusticola]